MSTQQYVKQLIEKEPSDEHFQKIISAMRGPDMVIPNKKGILPNGGLERAKHLTTGRIRGIVAPDYCGTTTLSPLCKHEIVERDMWLEYLPEHFKSHYREAVEAIRHVFGWDLKREVEWKPEVKAPKLPKLQIKKGPNVDSYVAADVNKEYGQLACYDWTPPKEI